MVAFDYTFSLAVVHCNYLSESTILLLTDDYSLHTGAVCQLYFDLEFSRVFNPESNAVRMVETFIKVLSIL